MNKKNAFLIVLFLISAVLSFPFSVPETAVTRSLLFKDLDRSDVTVGVGIELYSENPDPEYYGEILFGYIGYAPLDWLELGVVIHTGWRDPYLGANGKVDLIDVFAESNRVALIIDN